MTITKFIKPTIFIAGLLSMAAIFSRCSPGSSGGGSGSAITVSGNLSLAATTQSGTPEDMVNLQSLNLALYSVTCATSTTPILYGTGTVAADGSFSVDIIGAVGQPMSCYLVLTSDGSRAADFLIVDSVQKDLNGESQVSGTAIFAADANMGTIVFDPNSGEVTVPSANVAGVIDSTTLTAGTLFDPTGAWTIGPVDFTLPSGVRQPCTTAENNSHTCNGPPDGQTIYMKLWKGIKISDSSEIFGMQLWDSATQFATCGSKIGLTTTIKTQIGVDFSANGAADDVFSFATSVPNFHDEITSSTGTVTLTENWKMDTATSQYPINTACGPKDFTIGTVSYSNAWMCGPDLVGNGSPGGRYQVQLGGGCTSDATGLPVQINDWSGISTCSNTADSDGIITNSCSGTGTVNGASTAVHCSNKWAVTNGAFVVDTSGTASFNWSSLTQISAATACSAIANGGSSDALKIAQLQCYANYYWQSGFDRNSNACVPKVEMDWSAQTPADFAEVDKIRPNGLVFFEQFKPFSDGSGGTMVTRQEHFNGVQIDGNSWVNCRVIETGGLTTKRISDTKLLATYQSSEITTSISKPACVAKFTGTRKTFVFYLNK